jgi:uncharacterized protein (DUF934 family)
MNFIRPLQDRWQPCGVDIDAGVRSPPRGHRLLTLPQWLAVRDGWPAHLATGLLLDNTADVEELVPYLPRLELIALQFPKWTDGRAYSQARLLRSRLGFAGELRATGEVLVDMLPLLQRCGFDAVALRVDQSLDAARRALGYFAGHYQRGARSPATALDREAA